MGIFGFSDGAGDRDRGPGTGYRGEEEEEEKVAKTANVIVVKEKHIFNRKCSLGNRLLGQKLE